jgi:hypothetical protein
MLSIGTLYAHGYVLSELERLASLGFSLRPAASWYAGAQSLRFVDFSHPPALELISVEDERKYANFIPHGMTAYSPGVSLVIDPGSGRTLEDYQTAFKAWNPYRIHVGYQGGTDPTEPGWNYLNFATPIVEKTFIYLTEYEEPKPQPPPPVMHPNTSAQVTGIVFDIPLPTLTTLSRLSSQRQSDGPMALGNITVFGESHVPPEVRLRRKPFPLVAVVISVQTLRMHAESPTRPHSIDWLGESSILLEMNPLSWDIILTT